MPKVKKIPQRQCVGCREMKDKKALLRVVRAPDGTVSSNFGGKKPGRGRLCVPRRSLASQKARKPGP
ncbi:MAG: YlxR family protein [Oscillibacter sp.]